MAETGVIRGLVVGQYGDPILWTVCDSDGVAVDISGYSSSQVVNLRSPDNLKTVSFTAAFQSTGSDGKITFTPVDGNIDRPGNWTGQIVLTGASKVLKTAKFTVVVDAAV